MRHALLPAITVLTIAAGPIQAQFNAQPSPFLPQAVKPISVEAGAPDRQLFGSVLLEAVTDNHLALAVDIDVAGQRGDGWVDLVVSAETTDTVEQISPYQGFAVISVEERRIELLMPEQGATIALSLDMVEEEPRGRSTLVQVSNLTSWVPRGDQSLTLEEALLRERYQVEETLRSLSGAELQERNRDEDSDGGTGGTCASSISITCQDGTSASASCGSTKCASCACPNATCGCQ